MRGAGASAAAGVAGVGAAGVVGSACAAAGLAAGAVVGSPGSFAAVFLGFRENQPRFAGAAVFVGSAKGVAPGVVCP